jgi:predicted ATPase
MLDPEPEIRSEQAIRLSNGRFAPGRSGNAGGRPRVLADLQELAREHSAAAIETLGEIMQDPEQPALARVAAANSILDRGWGKPLASVSVSQETSEEAHERFLAAVAAAAVSAIAKCESSLRQLLPSGGACP